MKCPICGSEEFYIKDPDDEYEMYECKAEGNEVLFVEALDENERPILDEKTEAFCNQCAWHGKFQELRERGKHDG